MQRYAAREDEEEITYRVPPSRHRLSDFSLRRIGLAAGFLTCLVVLGVSVWSALTTHRGGTPPVIEAARGPMRVRPDNPGGMQLAGQNEDILSTDPSARSGQLAPGPEAPAPDVLRARQRAAAAAAAAAPPPPMPQSVSLPPNQAPASPTAIAPVPPSASLPPIIAAPAAAPAPIAAPAPVAAQAPRPATPGAGRVQAQLAAVGSEQAAKSEWQRLAKKMPDVLGGRQPVLVKVEREGQALWRVRTGGFADKAQATAFCEQVKAKGGNCAVAVF